MSEPPWPPGSYAEAHAKERARIEAEHKANEPPGAMLDESWILTAENLDCLGLRRAFKDDFFSDLKKQAEEEYFANLHKPPKSDKPIKNRKPNVIQQARTAGIDVARIEMKPDGTVVIITGKPEPAEPENPWPLDEFRTKETKQ